MLRHACGYKLATTATTRARSRHIWVSPLPGPNCVFGRGFFPRRTVRDRRQHITRIHHGLADDGRGHAVWNDRHVEDLNRPYGLAWQGDHVLVADQDGIWSMPHILGALRAGRSETQRVDQVPPEERKPIAGAYGAKMLSQKGMFGIAQGHQNH
jgi:hypothetical protein